MLTVATVPAGQMMVVATPRGHHSVEVPRGCEVGVFFQFVLPEPVPVSEFRTWPRQIAVTTTTTTMTDVNGDGVTDVLTTTTTQSVATIG